MAEVLQREVILRDFTMGKPDTGPEPDLGR